MEPDRAALQLALKEWLGRNYYAIMDGVDVDALELYLLLNAARPNASSSASVTGSKDLKARWAEWTAPSVIPQEQ